jgi:hypothetical protein
MMGKTILAATVTAALVVLLAPSKVDAWGGAHVGYTHVGPYGVYHTGRTVGYGPGGFYEGGRTGAYGYGGAYRGYGYGYGRGGAYGGYRYGATGYYDGYRYVPSYSGGVYGGPYQYGYIR